MGERRGTKALEIWCKRMTEGYLNVKIDNMTTSWRNGLAFCAMIHHFRPDLIDFDKLNKNDIYHNNDLAFRTAEQYLGIPALLDADDMASYEVPDRLSILTYLSQFYQVFASQDSPNRLKRNSTSTVGVETTVSKSAGPPSKMAHIVGVPKREPCLKCSLPVFLAERLIIGKAVYHRTCLKCARCKTQLTPGSFYETEIDGEFCCETCPDEEQTEETFSITDNNTDNYHTSNLNIKLSPNSITETKNNRSSIADRLAFFEMNISCGDGKKLLQKSLSDEEKSKSLKKITEFKPNTALTSFMNSTINDDKKSDDDDDDSADDREYIQDVENSLCIPPMLPKTIPPSVSLQEEYEENLLENSSSSAENESNKMFGNINTGTYDALDSSTILPLNKTQNNNNKYNNNDPNVSVNVTKEDDSNSTVKQKNVHMKKHAELYIQQLPDSEIEISTKNHNSEEPITNDLPELNVIRARLHQFDVINKSGSENNTNLNINTSSSDNDNKILSINSSNEISNIRINLVDNRSDQIVDDSKNIQICKDEEKVPKYTDSKEEQNNFKLINNISNDNTSYLQENVILKNINVDIKSSPEKQVVVNTETIIITNNKPVEASQDNKIDEEHEHINLLEDDKQQMNTISKSNDKIENQESILIIKKEADDENDEISIEINSVENTMQYNQHVEEQSTLNVEYPEELNPFQSDDNDDEDDVQLDMKKKRKSLNPFGSSDEEEDDNEDGKNDLISDKKLKPPRPPPPKISNNPFGSGSENDEETESINITNVSTSIGNNSSKKLPIPTPRTQICSSLKKQTPESTPIKNLNNYDYYGSSASLNAAANNSGHREIFHRHHEVRGSNTSLTSSTNGGSSRKSKKAPAPPPPTTSQLHNITKELFAPDSVNSTKSSPNSSSPVTPQQPRKKRPAPKPPATPKIEIEKIGDEMSINLSESAVPTTTTTVIPSEIPNTTTASFKHSNIPEIGKLSDEEKAANLIAMNFYVPSDNSESETEMNESQTPRRRLISLDKSLLEDTSSTNDVQLKEEHNVIYRRSIRPPLDITTPTKNNGGGDLIVSFPISIESATNNRQLEKMKDNKEAKNRNRQSQCSDDSDPLMNKSTHGKWKRRKGPAPSLPIPPRKVLQMLPLQEIRHELEIIEVQQQGLEKQGVILETMIRERCESKNGKLNEQPINNDVMDLPPVQNSKEVEDLILQLFELVNEKNELFRRQAELMYLRRQHRLEQEQADLEYEIRVLMAQPERNKTDTDKAREEALIARLVEVVQLRNEVIECLEMDRLREAEEDLSIKQRLELHTAKRDEELNKQTPTKLSKKEKKKQKETKKMGKSKKLDADKDADESELNVDNQKDKKKKKKFLF